MYQCITIRGGVFWAVKINAKSLSTVIFFISLPPFGTRHVTDPCNRKTGHQLRCMETARILANVNIGRIVIDAEIKPRESA